MNENRSGVVKIIKDYVCTCGGDVTVPELIEDYQTSFNSDIPFRKFGYKSLIDFLTSIFGITVIIIDGEYHIQPLYSPSPVESNPSLSRDMSLLCIEMKNNLLFPSSDPKRKVTIKAENSVEYHSENSVRKRYNSFNSIKSEQSSSSRVRNMSSANSSEFNDFSDASTVDCLNSNARYDSGFQNNYISLSTLYDSSLSDVNYGNFSKPSMLHEDCSVAFPRFNTQENILYFELPDQHPLVSPISNKQVVNRLVALVNAQQEKSSSSAVEFNYLDSYSDSLPKNWLALLEESNLLYIEHLDSEVAIYPKRTFASIPSLSVLPKMKFPDQVQWSVNVTNILSTYSIWFRLNENNFKHSYETLLRELQKHYADTTPGSVASVDFDQLFVAKLKGKVVRVCVLGQESDCVNCLAIDEGIMEKFPMQSLMNLHEKFTNTPRMALQGSLVDLDKCAQCHYVRQKLEEMIAGKETSIIVEKIQEEKLMMNLFVTNPCDSVNVNEYLLDMIKSELYLPKLVVNEIYDVIVLTLGENSTAKVHVMSPCYNLLQDSLQKAKHIIEGTDERLLFAKTMVDVQLNELYLAKYNDGTWQRILLKQFIDAIHVAVIFVDFQDVSALKVTSIVRFIEFPDPLSYIPPQALNVNFIKTDYAVLKFMNHKLRTNMFSMKIVEIDPKLYVQMYLKLPENRSNFNKYCTAV